MMGDMFEQQGGGNFSSYCSTSSSSFSGGGGGLGLGLGPPLTTPDPDQV